MQVTDVVVLVLVPLQRYRFGQRRQQEELIIWQLIQSLLCFISPSCHHQLHNFALEQKLRRKNGRNSNSLCRFFVFGFYFIFLQSDRKKVRRWRVGAPTLNVSLRSMSTCCSALLNTHQAVCTGNITDKRRNCSSSSSSFK